MKRLMNNARTRGISNPYAYVQLMIGSIRMAMGSVFGAVQAGSGAARLTMQTTLQNKAFHDWITRESGVEQSQIPIVRNAIAQSYPYLRKLMQSSVIPRATSGMIQ